MRQTSERPIPPPEAFKAPQPSGCSLKRAVSVSLGSSSRDSAVEVELMGQRVLIERRGVDGDQEKAAALFAELDGKVDALGVGGTDLWVQAGSRRYPLKAAHRLVRHVHRTPVVDGMGLKTTLESRVVRTLIKELGPEYASGRVLLTAAMDRVGMARAFAEQGYRIVCGDIMFVLGLPIPLRRLEHVDYLARLFMPIGCCLPLRMLYPMGDKQNEIKPRFRKWYEWATVIAGDCHYIKRHMPDDLHDKVIVTNTTTLADLDAFRRRGVRFVVTTTPQLAGRSFGANAMEAALTAASGLCRPLTSDEMTRVVSELNLEPMLHRL